LGIKFNLKNDVVETHPLEKHTGDQKSASDKPIGPQPDSHPTNWKKDNDST